MSVVEIPDCCQRKFEANLSNNARTYQNIRVQRNKEVLEVPLISLLNCPIHGDIKIKSTVIITVDRVTAKITGYKGPKEESN